MRQSYRYLQNQQGPLLVILEQGVNDAEDKLLQRMTQAIRQPLLKNSILLADAEQGRPLAELLEDHPSKAIMVLASVPSDSPPQALDHLRSCPVEIMQRPTLCSYHPNVVGRSSDTRAPSWTDWQVIQSWLAP